MLSAEREAQMLAFHGKTGQTPIFWDMYGMPGFVGSIVAYGDTPEMQEESDISYKIVANDEMSGMTEIMEITDYVVATDDKGGKSLESDVIYVMPVISTECWKLVVIYI